MTEKELQALASLLDEDDTEILTMVEKQIYSLGSQMVPFLEKEWQKQPNEHTQKRIETIVHKLQYNEVWHRMKIWKQKETQDLLKGLWVIATYRYPQANLLSINAELEQIYYEVLQVYRESLHPYDQVRIINSIIFGKLRFKPNPDFQSIENSMINKVLENKIGNPITLCCIYMLVAQKLTLPIYGVNLPNIFILTYKNDIFQFYINPTNKGVIFHRSDIDNYIEQLNITSSDVYYEPCNNENIIKRVLRNLMYAYEKADDLVRMKEVKKLLDIFS